MHDVLMHLALDSEEIPRNLRRMVPGLQDAELASVSEKLWLSWPEEVAVRELTLRLRCGMPIMGSTFWQEVERFLGDPDRSFWSGVPLLRLVRRFSEEIVPYERRREVKRGLDHVARLGNPDHLRAFLGAWRDLLRIMPVPSGRF